LKNIYRIKKIKVNWIGTPQEWKFQTTQDMTKWEDGFDYTQCDKKWFGSAGFIVLIEPQWIRGVRLIMKPDGRYIGFTSMDIYKQQYTVQI